MADACRRQRESRSPRIDLKAGLEIRDANLANLANPADMRFRVYTAVLDCLSGVKTEEGITTAGRPANN